MTDPNNRSDQSAAGAGVSPGRVTIIGGSLGGLITASLLHQAGWDVHVYERATESLSSRGAGLTTHPSMIAALERAVHVAPGALSNLGSTTRDRSVLATDGSVRAETPLPQLMVAWDAIYRLLMDAMPEGIYHTGMPLVGVDQTSDEATAVFEDGRRVSSDFLIGADGIRSTVRGVVCPNAEPRYAGYVAWRGLIPESRLSERALEVFDTQMVYCLPTNEHILAYMVTGENNVIDRGQRRLNWVWYRQAPTGPARDKIMTDRSGTIHKVSIPPAQIRPDLIAEMKAHADEQLAPVFAEAVRVADQPLIQEIYDLESPDIVFDRVILIGDAAFVARPHVGMGVTKVAGDAQVLAECLSVHTDLDSALAGFRDVRLPFGQAAVDRGRALGSCLTIDGALPAGHPFDFQKTNVGAVINETASDHWVGALGWLPDPERPGHGKGAGGRSVSAS